MKSIRLFAACALALAGTVHAQSMPMPMAAASSPAASALPRVAAEIRKIDTGRSMVVLKHGEIPNLGMPPMAMGFDVDRKKLKGFKVGDKVTFQADMVGGKATVVDLQHARK